jgi:hypothetical protein
MPAYMKFGNNIRGTPIKSNRWRSASRIVRGERKVRFMLHAFLDESGTHAQAPVACVAGFWGSGNQWRTFRKMWKPWCEGFHAKNSKERFPRLFGAIQASKINGIVLSVGNKTYKSTSTDHFRSALGNAYSLCALLCATDIAERVYPKRVSFVLENGQPNIGFVKAILETAMLEAGDWVHIASVATALKEDFIELHAADFFSHIVSTHNSPWIEKFGASNRMLFGHVTGERIEKMSPQIKSLIVKQRTKRRAERRRALSAKM